MTPIGLEAEAQDSSTSYDQRSPGYQPFSPISPGAPPQVLEQGYPPESYYPYSNQFAPPPAGAQYSPQPAYNPGDYAHGAPPQGYAPQGYSPPPQAAYGGGRRGDENVSPGFAPDPRTAEEGG